MNFHPLITIAVVLFFGYLAFLAIRKIRRDNLVEVTVENLDETLDEKSTPEKVEDFDPAGDVDNPGSDAAILEKGIIEDVQLKTLKEILEEIKETKPTHSELLAKYGDIFRNRSTFDYDTLKALEAHGVSVPLSAYEQASKVEEQRAEAAKEFDSVLTDAPVSTTASYADAVEYKKPSTKKAKKAVEVPESKKPANAKFTDANIREIRKLYETAGHDITTLSILFDASPRTIDRIVKRQTYVQVV